MRELLINLTTALAQIGPTFLQVPPKTDYPYITIEPDQSLQGLPGGPRIVTLFVKIWSRYTGTQEILKLAKGVENLFEGEMQRTLKVGLKILESSMILLNDGQTRLYTFRLKTRLSGNSK